MEDTTQKTAMCIICNMVLKIQSNSGVWNLKRHVSRLHPNEFEKCTNNTSIDFSSRHSAMWSCFARNRAERTAVCKMCGEQFECNVKPTMKMKQHLLRSHSTNILNELVKKI